MHARSLHLSSTVHRRTNDMWSLGDKEEDRLLDKADPGLCGPAGSAVIAFGSGRDRILMRAWMCDNRDTPCDYDDVVTDTAKRRAFCAAVPSWSDEAAMPQVPAFLTPVGAPGR